ncbi:hypothetical protein GGH91_002493 [Coemansia sp. RSA 2671]|uniref:Uncharacterized protein n=1 Tax=Coemansia linderi TaxID=2663919 RepID=A0ACC1KE65_9FUNG|nr:hypothetical protein LPJ60_003130 [Coemansia sp. RSA 2675]KAJ2027418.1 hypothetical protein IWW57_002614 [Coemansia sp. S610]KAJ2345566.1 hypothetical protein GGH91_002493 [Coemansia sp. RSA 2671]KAJ2380104.1 hypothetical protein H4S02_006849 [Coemansia sp. RSA 2611]KAJ2414268.1 hypothetical protein GGI10_002495 [Coemansia sp. RSA 2530]KAJ2694092.1 hypothetical protein H4218_005771 [Coemansia sp. IMI 209128]KAJ2788735.1 hypothetical protein GGI18_002787 [Coemansia linderi]
MRAELLQDNLEFTAKCEQALAEIFERYDLDKDGALNDEEIQAFATFTNGSPFTESDLADIRTNLDCNEQGALLKGGFLQLYSLQTNAGDDDETWADLKKHGYNDRLELLK